MSIETISSTELLERLSQHPVCVLDVRTTAEVKSNFFPGAINIPLDQLEQDNFIEAVEKSGYQANPIYLLCQSGMRAELAAKKLSSLAGLRLVIIEGGMKAIGEGVSPEPSASHGISIERQVRMTVGIGVVVTVLAGVMVSPYFLVLTALMGMGLAYAGFSNTCALALLLAKAPWNKAK